ncbi:hypothetical protein AT1G54773 [Arabidopsis thaliana]|uniref:Uncharacterized protein n=2 Tax=Arabidopsis thaliana TaxID=3702 RepID=A0A1P8AVS4_ARATH|nr:uncharacterized protein AT1G54773 [Arabidopsis thaliana]ANM60707.1 hypothetical protein AT1G54773 [Arabidopsis thaliana]CAA0295248.1 unnamed protein product [Arabidopsis thaliana]|eukprot:NP_001336514.1 hypothetical protein AT1G54773 [Arabidopsis thaliana]
MRPTPLTFFYICLSKPSPRFLD